MKAIRMTRGDKGVLAAVVAVCAACRAEQSWLRTHEPTPLSLDGAL